MRFHSTLIAVRDMNRSLEFYQRVFDQRVVVDLGWNKTLECGLVLQEHFDKIADFPVETMNFGSHNMELYFETDDLDAFLAVLDAHPEVRRLHELRTFPWKQRGIHIYDPDGHLIEVSEPMYVVACREFDQGYTTKEVAERIQHPIEIVNEWYKQYCRE